MHPLGQVRPRGRIWARPQRFGPRQILRERSCRTLGLKKTPMLVFPMWLGRAGGFIPAVGMDWVTWVCSPSFIPLFFPPHFATHFLFSGCSVFICRDAEMLAMLWTTQSSHRASPSSKFPRYTTQTCRRMPHASCQLPFEALSCFPQHSSLLQCKNPFWQRRGFFFFFLRQPLVTSFLLPAARRHG